MVKLSPVERVRSIGTYYHYAWIIVAIGTVLQVTTSFIGQAFAILLVVLRDDFQWSLTAITLAYFFRSIISGVVSPFAGWVGDRYGARRAMLAGAIFYVVGMLLLSSLSHIWQLYLYYSIILGASQGLFSVNIPTTVGAWFRKRLGMASGIQQSAGGMASSIMAPVLALLLASTDWQTAFWIIAAVGGAIILSLLALFHGDPADRGMRPYGSNEDEPEPTTKPDPVVTKLRSGVFLRHASRTRAFWDLIAVHYLGCVGHAIVMVGVVFFATTTHQLSLGEAAWIVSIYSFCSVASRFSTPVLADLWGAKGVMALAYFVQGITVALLFWTHDPWQFYIFAALFGIGLGGEMSAFLVINRQYYGMGPVRTIYGLQTLGAGFGMGLGGLVGSVIFDLSGSYDLAWVISIAASLGGMAFILVMEPTSRMLIPNWEESLPQEARPAADVTP